MDFCKDNARNTSFLHLKRDKKQFEAVVVYIRKHGIKEEFVGKQYIYLYLGNFKYWTMGEAIKDTILINRVTV